LGPGVRAYQQYSDGEGFDGRNFKIVAGCDRIEESLMNDAARVIFSAFGGGIAQLVERLVRNEKARGSNPLTSSLRLLSRRGLGEGGPY
jgi:hypothetical protein